MNEMETQYNDDVLPHHVARHLHQVALEKAQAQIDNEEVQSLCDRVNEAFRDVERGQVYPINTFR